ncbi:type VI secretion system baseplate subunit TssE [Nitratireductor sp. ZSWI3]|uniref:type VI secretion system baseplate subunit TssE n=1 Tax=Nitratireductor sp. ZSWI3 TaxID=2966359 RepID=UPI00214F88AA|nr:type VI secretion system baseplate subunit TssE [Nitratireductor sp. ZSWI3]MCR4266313.1 type VI secretion system baseplate subunit TssE [Nitratireductor sp. ZSWI3]
MPDPLERYRPGERVLARSILDRLVDPNPESAADPQVSLVDQVREMREAIRRDLEALLNTRRCPSAPPAEMSELRDSLHTYGMDGIVSANLVTDESKLALARSLERRISMVETRLSDVHVTILQKRAATERTLRLRIQASFRLHEGMPPISFESTIDPSTQRFLVEAPRG